MAIRIGRRLIEKDDEGDRARKVDLKSLELPMQPAAPSPYAPQKLDLNARREKLDFHLGEFRRLASAARKEAEIYLAQHSLMLDELEAEKVKLAEQQKHLDRLEAGLPKFDGGKDEEDQMVVSGDNIGPDNDTRPGQIVMSDEPGEGEC